MKKTILIITIFLFMPNFVLALVSLVSIVSGFSIISPPKISDAYVHPSKVRPGETMLVVSLVQDEYGIGEL